MESLDGYPDDQVGAAARDVQRDLAQAVARIFAPEPLLADAEGARVEVPRDSDPARYRLTVDLAAAPPTAAVQLTSPGEIRLAVKEMGFAVEEDRLRLTVSLGVASYQSDACGDPGPCVD